MKKIPDIKHNVLVFAMDDDGDLPVFSQNELTEIRDYVANWYYVLNVLTAVNNNLINRVMHILLMSIHV